jgi:hypothetical protein
MLQSPQSTSQDESCMTPVVQTPVWPETVTPADQRHKTDGTLPKIPALPYSQYPVSWFKHHGIEEEIVISELINK